MNQLHTLYKEFRATPFPTMGGDVGDFLLYDALLAGYVDRAAREGEVDVANLPDPDPKTVAVVRALRMRDALSDDEAEFLGYYDMLEKLRAELMRAV